MKIKFLLLKNTKMDNPQMMVIYFKKLIKKFLTGGVEKLIQKNLTKFPWTKLYSLSAKMLLSKQLIVKFPKNNLLNQ